MNIPPINLSQFIAAARTTESENRPIFQATSVPGEFAIQIDNSSLELFVSCPRKSLHRHILGWSRPGGAALTNGSAIHRALELRYAHPHLSGFDLLDVMHSGIDQIFSGTSIGIDEWRTPSLAKEVCRKYILEYPHESFTLLSHDGQPANEIGFSRFLGSLELEPEDIRCPEGIDPANYFTRLFGVPHRERIEVLHVFWTGRIDLAVADVGENWVMDHKTSSIMGPTYWKQFELSMPQIGYCWAWEDITGVPVSGTWINCIISRRPTRTGTAIDFERRKFPYARWQLAEWPQNVLKLVAAFTEQLIKGDFVAHFKDCVNLYGVCEFHDVCTAPCNQREMILRTMFTQHNWSPLKK